MVFSTNSALNAQKKDVRFLGAGIHENVAFAGARAEESTNGNFFIEFKYEKDGSVLTQTEYEPKLFPGQSEADMQTKAEKQVARILQTMSAFYTKEQLSNFEANSYREFAKWVVSMMNAVDKKELVRLKAVYGTNGFVGVPRYSNYTFIESMRIPKEMSSIRELNADRFEKPEIADVEEKSISSTMAFDIPTEKAEPALFATGEVPTTPSSLDDMPF